MLVQTSRTKNFIKKVNYLIESGEVKDYISIVNKLKWNNTSLSNVLKGRRNVPNEIYIKFAKLYGIEEEKITNETIHIQDGHTFQRLLKVLEQQSETINHQQKTIHLLAEKDRPPDETKKLLPSEKTLKSI